MHRRWWSWVGVGLVLLLIGGAVGLGDGVARRRRLIRRDAGGGLASAADSRAGSKPFDPDRGGLVGRDRLIAAANRVRDGRVRIGSERRGDRRGRWRECRRRGGARRARGAGRYQHPCGEDCRRSRSRSGGGRLADTLLEVTHDGQQCRGQGLRRQQRPDGQRTRRADAYGCRPRGTSSSASSPGWKDWAGSPRQSLRGDDVTAQYTDLEGRLRNARAARGRAARISCARRAASRTRSPSSSRCRRSRSRSKQLEGQRRVLDDQSSFGTLTATFAVRGAALAAATPEVSSTLWPTRGTNAAGVSLNVIGGTLVLRRRVAAGRDTWRCSGLAGWVVVRRRRRGGA